MNKKNIISYILVMVISILYLVVGAHFANKANLSEDYDSDATPIRAKVVEITKDTTVDSLDDVGHKMCEGEIYFNAEIKSGENKGQVVDCVQTFDYYMTIVPPKVQEGSKVIIYNSQMDDFGASYLFTEFIRSDALVVLSIVFALLLILFGKKQGFNTLVSLAFTTLAVFWVFIPAVLSGFNAYAWSILTCIYTTFMTIYLVSGVNRKANIAILGCLGGIVFSGLLMIFMNKILNLSGLSCEDSMYLITAIQDVKLDLIAITFGGIIIGAMGAIMDVAMSIASALGEIKEKNPNLSVKELFVSGINISRDIMGTMANTLILAYIGSCLPSALLLFSYYSSIKLELFNMELIVTQILQALVGSMGILVTLPLTSILGALFLKNKKAQEQNYTYAENYFDEE